MNEIAEARLANLSSERFAALDEARSKWLATEMKRDGWSSGGLCKRGHNHWGRKTSGARYCLTCHAEREKARRSA